MENSTVKDAAGTGKIQGKRKGGQAGKGRGMSERCDCEGYPLKEKKLGGNERGLVGKCGPKDTPLKGKTMGNSHEEAIGEKWAEKLPKLSFLGFEMVRKMDISRQAK